MPSITYIKEQQMKFNFEMWCSIFKFRGRIPLSIILFGLYTSNVKGQVTFSSVESKLEKSDSALIFTSPSTSIKFATNRAVALSSLPNFVIIDDQNIQITSLEFDGYQKETNGDHLKDQKNLLATYSKYELAYFKNEIGVEIINPNSQWVISNSRGWFIWYFRSGKISTQVGAPTGIQLFATTVIGDNILIINAPVMIDGDFAEAAYIVNDLMEALTIVSQ